MKIEFDEEKYESDIREYNSRVLNIIGASSPIAERETIYLAENGNTVAAKLYADLIFYKKLPMSHPYREAFYLYQRSAGISVDENGSWSFDDKAYPLSYWMVGYYLINYRRESVLRDCETIDVLEAMTLPERFGMAYELAEVCAEETKAAGAINLLGRIFMEASEDAALFEKLEEISGREDEDGELSGDISRDDLKEIAEDFFALAAENGYVYAANNLAAKEAELVTGADDDAKREAHIREYIKYLKLSADKFEPYAANRLGLFYVTGEIKSEKGRVVMREYINLPLAKEYFIKATIHPDTNSAWAYFNLIKYFHKDYVKDLDLLGEHMDRIKELSGEVYDLAMEL